MTIEITGEDISQEWEEYASGAEPLEADELAWVLESVNDAVYCAMGIPDLGSLVRNAFDTVLDDRNNSDS